MREIGFLFIISGLVAYLRHVFFCKRVITETSDQPDGLSLAEITWSIHYYRMKSKLRTTAKSNASSPDLKAWASGALKFNLIARSLFITGMVLAALGSLSQG